MTLVCPSYDAACGGVFFWQLRNAHFNAICVSFIKTLGSIGLIEGAIEQAKEDICVQTGPVFVDQTYLVERASTHFKQHYNLITHCYHITPLSTAQLYPRIRSPQKSVFSGNDSVQVRVIA
uniref:Uncharacterized protein n=1 Tax=Panagrellus redivivus TaxID=6233 RepID=A0A7E4UM25_PANRE